MAEHEAPAFFSCPIPEIGSESPSPDLLTAPSNRCPRKLGWSYVNRTTGQMVPARCGAHFCGHCGPLNARVEALAIGLAAPERAIRFSLVGEDFQRVRKSMNKLVWKLRQDGFATETSWHREPNPKGTGHHIHAWQHGDYIPQDQLQDRCAEVGWGHPYIDRIKSRGNAVGYGLKGISYGLKTAESAESMETYLDANGGRLVHATRGFWRDGKRGERLTLVEARKRVLPKGEGEWVLVRDEAA